MDLIAEMTAVVSEASKQLKTKYLTVEARVTMIDGEILTEFHGYSNEIGSWEDATLSGLKEKLIGVAMRDRMRKRAEQLRKEAEEIEAKL